MGAPSWPRTVQVLGPEGRYGSGTLIAPGLVLTAWHVVSRAGDSSTGPIGAQVRVKVLRDQQEHPMEVTWAGDRELDAVLLRADPGRLGRDLAPARWGELTCSSPRVHPECSAVGFPRAMQHQAVQADGTRAVVHDNREVIGRVSPVTGLNASKYDLDVSNALPRDISGAMGWSGLSGAGLFCHDILVGLILAVPEAYRGQTLWALPIRRLLARTDFTALVTEHTGVAPRLESADQSVHFHEPPIPRLSPSYLLSPQAEVVPFTGRGKEIAHLTSWCTSSRVVDVSVVFGPGGVGKTRLATELTRRMTSRRSPWTAGFLSDVQRAGAELESLKTNLRPLLLVVDYAETRLDQVEQVLNLFTEARHAYDKVRVLLLARTTQRWWTDLEMQWQGSTVMERGTEVQLGPFALHDRIGSPESTEIAAQAFRSRITHLAALEYVPSSHSDSSSVQATEPPPDDPSAAVVDEVIVSIHMTALARVLEGSDISIVDAVRPVDVLLTHESRYWRHSVRSHGLDGAFRTHELLRQLVAVQRIVGAEKRRNALNAVMVALRFHERDFDSPTPPDPELTRRLEQMLADLYPATDGARWGAMSPDILAAELIVLADRESDNELVVHVLPDAALSEAQQQHALTALARASTHQPQLADRTARAVARGAVTLLRKAVDVTAELPSAQAITWLTALKSAAVPTTSSNGDEAGDQHRRIDRLLGQLRASSGTSQLTGLQSIGPVPEPDPSDEAQQPAGSSPQSDANAPGASDRKYLAVLLPPQAHPGSRKPIPAWFLFASGAVISPRQKERMNRVLRCLADEARRSGRSLPALNTLLIGVDASVKLNLSSESPAIAPFHSESSNSVWHCPADQALPPESGAHSSSDPYPALVHLGWAPDGTITFADLEQIGMIQLDGPINRARSILGCLAFELATRPIGDRPIAHTTGFSTDAPSTPHASLEDALAAASAHAAEARSALQSLGVEHPRDARLLEPLNRLWRPRLILSSHRPTADAAHELKRILSARPQVGPVVVTHAASSDPGSMTRWTVTLGKLMTGSPYEPRR
ncbi:S1 family peptidase [Kitasatospora aureofaciens]|uniref:S1 family peptidase n=1 Tax=Kitasatospora aureofaciens TaxID=1894 RepID=UPI0027DFF069|nr:serine protease [Kitasatospora aureofaciens]